MYARDNTDTPVNATFAINVEKNDDLDDLDNHVDVNNLKDPVDFNNLKRHNGHGNPNPYDYNNYRNDEILRVSTHSRPGPVAGAIAGVVRSQGHAEVQAIGAGATNQAIKAVVIARDFLLRSGIEIVVVPTFVGVYIGSEQRTAIRLGVEVRAETPLDD